MFFSEFIVKYGQISCEISVPETTVFSDVYRTDHEYKFCLCLFSLSLSLSLSLCFSHDRWYCDQYSHSLVS